MPHVPLAFFCCMHCRPYKVLRHTMKGGSGPDVVVFEEKDEMFYVR